VFIRVLKNLRQQLISYPEMNSRECKELNKYVFKNKKLKESKIEMGEFPELKR
jgi:hypothetical protein